MLEERKISKQQHVCKDETGKSQKKGEEENMERNRGGKDRVVTVDEDE